MALYCVRFQYGLNIESPSSEEAIAKVSKMIQGAPEIAIRGAELATMYRKKGFLRTLFLG
jgi:hypothetical protein